jgi:dienelactone hydrolase
MEPPLTLQVAPMAGMVDQPVEIRVAGLRPGDRAEIHARLRDDRKRLWESHAVFVADGDGCVNLAGQEPVTGTYSGVDVMGLFWSMALDPARSGPPSSFVKKELPAAVVDLEVKAERGKTASARLERNFVAPGTEVRDVREEELVGRLFVPPGADKRPAVIVLGGSGGGLDWEKAGMISSHGYVTLALAYFGIPPLPRILRQIPLEYFATAVAWLRRQDSVRQNQIATLGASKGAELALLMGATFSEIRAVIGISSSGVHWQGFGKGPAASWTHAGCSLPYAPVPMTRFRWESLFHLLTSQPVAFRRLYELALRNREAVQLAAIPVEKIRGPVLLISGSDDQVWPSGEMSRMIMERLAANGFPYPFEHLCCDSAGHSFRGPYSPATVVHTNHPGIPGEILLGGSPAANARGQRESWEKTIAFLNRHFQP